MSPRLAWIGSIGAPWSPSTTSYEALMERADAIVVGAGVMGAAAAWRLTLAGRSVVLLEQFEVGHDRGSSHGAVRVFRFSYDEVQYVLMAMEALPLWRE